jgi:hypothetical protein
MADYLNSLLGGIKSTNKKTLGSIGSRAVWQRIIKEIKQRFRFDLVVDANFSFAPVTTLRSLCQAVCTFIAACVSSLP